MKPDQKNRNDIAIDKNIFLENPTGNNGVVVSELRICKGTSAVSDLLKLTDSEQKNCIELFENMKLNDYDIGLINSLLVTPEKVSKIISRGPETLFFLLFSKRFTRESFP